MHLSRCTCSNQGSRSPRATALTVQYLTLSNRVRPLNDPISISPHRPWAVFSLCVSTYKRQTDTWSRTNNSRTGFCTQRSQRFPPKNTHPLQDQSKPRMLSYKILLSLVAAGGVLSAPAPPHHPNSRGSEVGKRQEAPVPSSVVEPDTILPVGAVSSTTAVVPTVTPVTSVPAENVTSVGPVGDGGPECSLGVIHSGLQKAPASTQKRFVAYWSAYHGTNKGGQFTLPSKTQLDGVTHLILGE